jgi:hypothetical protein
VFSFFTFILALSPSWMPQCSQDIKQHLHTHIAVS